MKNKSKESFSFTWINLDYYIYVYNCEIIMILQHSVSQVLYWELFHLIITVVVLRFFLIFPYLIISCFFFSFYILANIYLLFCAALNRSCLHLDKFHLFRQCFTIFSPPWYLSPIPPPPQQHAPPLYISLQLSSGQFFAQYHSLPLSFSLSLSLSLFLCCSAPLLMMAQRKNNEYQEQ